MKNLRFLLLLCTFLNLSTLLFGQAPSIQWQKSLGGTGIEEGNCIFQTKDGGFIVGGHSDSHDGDVTGNHGSSDVWLVKLTSAGNIEWQKSLGGTNYDFETYKIQQTADDGYIVVGWTRSNDGDVSGNHGNDDFWVVKLSSAGNIEWQKTLGGSSNDYGISVEQTNDGGYIVAGQVFSTDGDVVGNHGGYDCFVVKLSSTGAIEWKKPYGGTGTDVPWMIHQTKEGGYIVAGHTNSNNGDVSGNHGNNDCWVLKLKSDGDIEWQKTYGGSASDSGRSISETSDGGYILSGQTRSNDGDVTGNHGNNDCWIVKLSNLGSIEWQKTLGGSNNEAAGWGLQQTKDGDYVWAGWTYSNDGDVTGNHGLGDYWIVKLSSTGDLKWQKALGGSNIEYNASVQQTDDGGYILAGQSFSNDGDVTGNHGNNDYWIVKLGPENTSSTCINMIGDTANHKFKQVHLDSYDDFIGDTTQPEIDAAAWTCNAFGVPLCNFRALIKYNLEEIPSNAVVASAKLHLYAKTTNVVGLPGSPTYGNNTSFLQQITSPWATNGTVGWQNQPSTITDNQKTLAQSSGTTQDYEVDITDFVQLWVNKPDSNFGAMLRLEDETYYSSLIFHSGLGAEGKKPLLEICYDVAMPVSLKNFEGSLSGDNTTLTWTTSDETNAANISLERSFNGTNFSKIATFKALGNAGINNYSTTDKIVGNNAQMVYYRLLFTDKNGRTKYSQVLSFRITKAIIKLSVYPNPANESVQISYYSTKEGTARVNIIDAAGRTILRKIQKVDNGYTTFSLYDLKKLSNGLYTVLVDKNDEPAKAKLLIQR